MEHYTNKRIADLQQQIIRNRWYNVELEKAVHNIHNKQQDYNKHLQKDMILSVGALFIIPVHQL